MKPYDEFLRAKVQTADSVGFDIDPGDVNRRGRGCELKPSYFVDSGIFCQAAEREIGMPTLYGLEELEAA